MVEHQVAEHAGRDAFAPPARADTVRGGAAGQDIAGGDAIRARVADHGDGRKKAAPALTNILFVSRTGGYGGAEKHLIDLIARLDPTCVRSFIVCTKTDPYTGRMPATLQVGIHHCERQPSSLLDWYRLFRRFRPDILVFIHGGLGVYGWTQYSAGRLLGVPRIIAIQHLLPSPLPPPSPCTSPGGLLRLLAGWRTRFVVSRNIAAKLCDKTICVSSAIRDCLVNEYGYAADRTVTVRNGIDVREFAPSATGRVETRQRLGIDPDEWLMVCLARMTPVKGIDILIDAVARLVGKGLRFRCVLVGDGEQRGEVESKIQNLGLSDLVLLQGFQADVRPYLQAADVFVLTSWQEGLPLAILEAMACGLPCVVTDVGGNAEAVGNKLEGFVVPPGAVNNVANAVEYLFTHGEERAKMAQHARCKVIEEFDIDHCMRNIEREILHDART